MIDVPQDSIYFWMYKQGLKHVPLQEILSACRYVGKQVRQKDIENYWNGWYRSSLYSLDGNDVFSLKSEKIYTSSSSSYFDMDYEDYTPHPYPYYPDVMNRWVPCNVDNKPMIKWGKGCMSLADAKAYRNQVYLAENLKGCKFIVIDCDGDHDSKLDMQTVAHLWRYASITHTLSKPKNICEYEGYESTGCDTPASFHLTFTVDRVIPTMHFPYAHIDIVGNKCNSLRYLKNKRWNGIQPVQMTPEIWNDIRKYITYRKEVDDVRNELARHA